MRLATASCEASTAPRGDVEALGHVVFERQGEANCAMRAFGTVLDVTARVEATVNAKAC